MKWKKVWLRIESPESRGIRVAQRKGGRGGAGSTLTMSVVDCRLPASAGELVNIIDVGLKIIANVEQQPRSNILAVLAVLYG